MVVASQFSKQSSAAQPDHWKRLYLSSRRLDAVHWSRPVSRLLHKQLAQQPATVSAPFTVHPDAASIEEVRQLRQSAARPGDLARCYHTVTPVGEQLLMLAGGLLRDGSGWRTLDVVLLQLRDMACYRPSLFGLAPCARYHHTATPIAVAKDSQLEQEVSRWSAG